jgi:hypothetical protein
MTDGGNAVARLGDDSKIFQLRDADLGGAMGSHLLLEGEDDFG